MVQILGGKLIREDVTSTARGGTELMAEKMVESLDPDLLAKFQIVHSRVRELDFSKKRIFVAHDLPGDPESAFLASGGYNQFDKIIFVSNWQMQRYIEFYGIPWHKCLVLLNAIDPLNSNERSLVDFDIEPVKIVYHTTPHRGLDILANAYNHFKSNHKRNITLDVYSSFEIYGWKQRDEEFKELFDFLKSTDGITYHGSVKHEELVEVLPTYDIFAYPSVWPETSCISLMEAMSAGLLCVHPNYAALSETAGHVTAMYQWQENKRDHLREFSLHLLEAIETVKTFEWHDSYNQQFQIDYANHAFDWQTRMGQWDAVLKNLL